MLPSSLTVSVVTYRSDAVLLERCLDTLEAAIATARAQGVIKSVAVALIDNSEDEAIAADVMRLTRRCFAEADVQLHFLHGHTNIGYGIAHNLMLNGTGADYQLVLNPDVELARDSLANAIRWLDAHSEVGAAAPDAMHPDGTRSYLCKRYPSVFDLLLRGFAPQLVRRMFRKRLAHYEMRDAVDATGAAPVLDPPVMSGCCMLVRRKAIDATGGFDPRFFLYFEDYDWSVRLRKVARTAFLPEFRIVHHGGDAARKGWKHIRWFVNSAFRFYGKHGWRFF